MQTNGSIYDLSQQYAIECEKISSNGCNGGYPLTALQLFNKTGIPLESNYPYQPSAGNYYTSRGKAICTDSNRVKLSVNTTKILHYSNLTTQQIQEELVASGPLTVAVFTSHPAFQYVGSSGLINNCPTDGGPDHAVLLVGYNSTHWFIKNSWGPSWGHNGYAYILKSNDCKLSTWVDVMRIESGSTPTPTPKLFGYTLFNISMTDSKGDGWNGNILAFKQDGVIVATFGQSFTEGKSSGPINVRIKNNIQTQIVVAQKGNFTNEIGFVVRNENGTVIHSRSAGTAFESNIIFKNFCPSSTCPTVTKVEYTVSLTDAYGDGWNGVVLAFRQNGVLQKFGDKFTSGAEFNPQIFTFQKYKNLDIIVQTPGMWNQEVGFVVRNRQGYVVAQRISGQSFDANSILATFCLQCVNLSPIRVVGNTQQRQQQKTEVSATESAQNYANEQRLQYEKYEIMKNLLISTLCLSGLTIILLLIIIVWALRRSQFHVQTKNKEDNYNYTISSPVLSVNSPQDTSVQPSSAQSLQKRKSGDKPVAKYLDPQYK